MVGPLPGFGEIGYLRGSRAVMLEASQVLELPIVVSQPLASYPDSSGKGVVFLGRDRSGQSVVCWVRLEQEQVKAVAIPLPGEVPAILSLDLDRDGTPEHLVFGRSTGWVVWSGPTSSPATFMGGEVLAIGDFDGDKAYDLLLEVSGEAVVWSPLSHKVTSLGPGSWYDRWLGWDISGAGAEQIIQVGTTALVRVHFLSPTLGDLTLAVPFVPANAVGLDLGRGGGKAVLITGEFGQALLLTLSPL